MSIELSTTLIFKGKISDDKYVRVVRVYDNHFIWYEEVTKDGTLTREVKILNKSDMLISFDMLIDAELIDTEQVNSFLK